MELLTGAERIERGGTAVPRWFTAIGRWGSGRRQAVKRLALGWLSLQRAASPNTASGFFDYLVILLGPVISTVVFLMWCLVRG